MKFIRMTINNSIAGFCLAVLIISYLASCGMRDGLHGNARSPHTGTPKSEKLRIRKDVATFAKRHIGAKYRYGGRSPSGFDCSGFTTYVMGEFNIPVSGPSYSQENLGRKVSEREARPGDLVFFRKSRMGKVFHVAIVYSNDGGDLTLVHSTSSRGVVMDRVRDSSYWSSKVMTVRDVIGD